MSCDHSKYIAYIIDTLNHDSSISDLLNPSERIQSIVARYMTGELDKENEAKENEANAAKTATAGDKNE